MDSFKDVAARLKQDALTWHNARLTRGVLVAGQLALADAGLRPGADGSAAPERIGIYLGSALGGIAYAEEQLAVGKRQVESGAAYLRQTVETEHVRETGSAKGRPSSSATRRCSNTSAPRKAASATA